MTSREARTLKAGSSHVNVRMHGRTYIGRYTGVRIVRHKPMLLVDIDSTVQEIPLLDADLLETVFTKEAS